MLKLIKICVLIFLSSSLWGQKLSDFQIIDKNIASTNKKIKKTKASERFKDHTSKDNEIEIVFSSLFLVYKDFFSSQDQSTCSFHPSCSEYGVLCMKQQGLIKGGIMTMDRLTRCNSLSPENYTIDIKHHKLYDPPKDF